MGYITWKSKKEFIEKQKKDNDIAKISDPFNMEDFFFKTLHVMDK